MFAVQDVVEITSQSDKRRCYGAIKFADKNHLIVACHAKDITRIQVGMQVALVQLINDGIYEMPTQVLRCQDNCFVVGMKPPTLIERRRSKRVICELSGWYVHDQVVPYGKEARADGRGKFRTIDLSMGGMQVYADQMLPLHTCCRVTLDLGADEIIETEAEILRCQLAEHSTTPTALPFVVSMKFVALSRLAQLQLQRFVQRQ